MNHLAIERIRYRWQKLRLCRHRGTVPAVPAEAELLPAVADAFDNVVVHAAS